MDIFRFLNPTAPTKLEFGQIVNGLKSKMWVERYREAGEFAFVANLESGAKEALPIGSIISHVDTTEVMIVENHEINDKKDAETEITITGRGFETFLENRIVGSNKYFPGVGEVSDYTLLANYTWVQAADLVAKHILAVHLIDDSDVLPYVEIITDVAGSGYQDQRSVQRGSVHERFVELLEIDDLGVKLVRPGPWSPLAPGSVNLAFVVHKGINRTSTVVFSYDTGEIESADYLWSNKRLKNSALVCGRWVEVRAENVVDTLYNRRMMYVDASDIDEGFTEAPSGMDLTAVIIKMEQRGFAAIAAQRDIALAKAEVSKDGVAHAYRTDYNVGDLITVGGSYNESTTMRVTEFVEIEDETGQTGYPTLSMDI